MICCTFFCLPCAECYYKSRRQSAGPCRFVCQMEDSRPVLQGDENCSVYTRAPKCSVVCDVEYFNYPLENQNRHYEKEAKSKEVELIMSMLGLLDKLSEYSNIVKKILEKL